MNFHRKHPERPFCNSLFPGSHLLIKIYPSFTSVEDGKMFKYYRKFSARRRPVPFLARTVWIKNAGFYCYNSELYSLFFVIIRMS